VLRELCPIVRGAHERYDEAGYPDGLAKADIPLGCRVVAVCDAFASMMVDRPYRERRSARSAIDEMLALSGQQFDPEVV
jgi:HD-GYP domain-containing protein (c-di-GMP phosphodiesterase class II)